MTKEVSTASRGSGGQDEEIEETAGRESIGIFLSLVKRNPLYLLSIVIVSLFLIYSLVVGLDPKILGYNPNIINVSDNFRPPSFVFPFGTDDVGRNIFLAVLYGAPLDAVAGVTTILFSLGVGLLFGATAGYFGGALDELIMRITDIFLAFPGLVLAAAMAVALGPGMINAIIAIMVTWWPIYVRLGRGETLSIKQNNYIVAARAAGMGRIQIVLSHVIPNALTSMIAYATADIGNVIILFSVLGYLGLGAQPPHVDLGRIVYDGQAFIQFAPWISVFPGIIIFIIVISFALTGDLIRDYFDPNMRR
jgi:peptide/nickel transport system permease protein